MTSSMDTSSVSCFLFLTLFSYQLLLLQLHYSVSAADDQSWYKRGCQQQIFNCGRFRGLKFPYTNETSYTCAPGWLNCSGAYPILTLASLGYEVKSFPTEETVKVIFQPLTSLKSSKSCEIFNYNISFWNSGAVSFTFTPNITLLKCYQPPPYNNNTMIGFHTCGDYKIYYSRKKGVELLTDLQTPPPHCQIITLPAAPDDARWATSGSSSSSGDLFSQLASEFTIRFHVSTQCQDCIYKGNRCSLRPSNFSCDVLDDDKVDRQPKRNKLPLILGTAILGGILVLCLFLLGIRYHQRWIDVSTYVFARSTSSDPSSTLDPEGGNMYFGVPIFSYAELQEATHNLDPSTELGDGGFGTVYLGKLKDGREVAVKRLYERNYKRVTQFQNEIEILTRLRHKNLVSLYGCTSSQSRELLLVYEYISNGTVADHLHGDRANNGPLTWSNRIHIALETASALVYLHASEIIHRDVKTNNILLDQNFTVKVADFGLSRLFPTDKTHVSTAPQGTPGYVDPEYHQCYQLTEKSDVYSFGVVLAELISSLPAVDISRHRHEINLANLAVNKIQSGELGDFVDPNLGFGSDPLTERMITSVAEVAFRCLQVDKDMRPSMDEVLETLQEIADYKDEKEGEKLDKVGSGKTAAWVTPSPESEDVILLKNVSTPDSMTDKWTSGSTTSTSNG